MGIFLRREHARYDYARHSRHKGPQRHEAAEFDTPALSARHTSHNPDVTGNSLQLFAAMRCGKVAGSGCGTTRQQSVGKTN